MAREHDSMALWRRGAVATAGAIAVNLAILATALTTGVSLRIPVFGGADIAQVGAGPVVMFTVVPMVLGLLAATLARRWSGGLRVVRVAAVVVLLVSLAPPLTIAADTATRLVLALMHPVAGGAFLLAVRSPRPAAGGARNVVGTGGAAT